MKVVLTIEDSVICKPDTIVIRFNYFDKKTTIAELKKCFREFVYKLDELITANKDLDVNKLEKTDEALISRIIIMFLENNNFSVSSLRVEQLKKIIFI